MRALSLAAFVALGFCAGCAGPNGWTPTSVSNDTCSAGSQQASLSPIACSHAGWPPRGTVITNANGNGPHVEIFGPPSWSGGGGGG